MPGRTYTYNHPEVDRVWIIWGTVLSEIYLLQDGHIGKMERERLLATSGRATFPTSDRSSMCNLPLPLLQASPGHDVMR